MFGFFIIPVVMFGAFSPPHLAAHSEVLFGFGFFFAPRREVEQGEQARRTRVS